MDRLETILSVIQWIVTGAVAGYLASLILRARRQGCFINIGLGIVGAFVGALIIRFLLPGLANLFGTGPVAGFFNNVLNAIIGAVIVLVLWELIMPGKQLGVRAEENTERKRERRRRRRW